MSKEILMNKDDRRHQPLHGYPFHGRPLHDQTLHDQPLRKKALKAQNVSIHYGAQQVLNSVDIELYAGELTALLGPNGAGKSTLLKCLSGEIASDCTSNCHLEYFSQANEKDQWQAKKLARHLAVLPQQSSLSFPFLVKEVIALGALPLDLKRDDAQAVCLHYMKQVEIEHLSERLYPSLSGGEKQRVHFARVLTQLHFAGDKKILMLDEPTSALDLAHQHNTLALARDLASQDAAIIVVLHDLNLAAQYADRLVLLSQGKIIKDAPPWHALTPEIIKQVYGYDALIDSHPTMDFPVVYPKG